MLSASLFALIVSIFVGALSYGQDSTAIAGSRIRASLISEEAFEASRNLRDNSFASLTIGLHGFATSSGSWVFSGVSDIRDGITRQIQIADADFKTKIATTTVSWQLNAQRTGFIETVNRLTNWRTAGWAVPSQLASVNIGGTPNGSKVKIQGNFAYAVMTGTAAPNFAVLNITNPATPSLAGSLTLASTPTNIAVSGNFAYVASQNTAQELQIVNISNPAAPVVAGNFNAAGTAFAQGVFVVGTTVYLVRDSSTSNELIIINATNPAAPTLLGSLNLGAAAREVFVVGNFAYISSGSNTQELQIVNISNPTSLSINGSLDLPGTADALTVTAFGTTTVLGQGTQIRAVNVSNPALPTLLGSFDTTATVNEIDLGNENNYIFVATNSATQEMQVIEIAAPASMRRVGAFSLAASIQGIAYDALRDRAFALGSADTEEFTVLIPEE